MQDRGSRVCARAFGGAETTPNGGMLGGRPRWPSSFLGDPGTNFFWKFTETLTAVAGAVGKVKIPLRLRDFQVLWESSAFGLFHGNGFFHGPCTHRWYREPQIHRRRTP